MSYRDTNHNPRLARAEQDYERSLEECSQDFGHVSGVHHLTTRLMKIRERRSNYGDRKLKAARTSQTE
jgi:hypothetical protein